MHCVCVCECGQVRQALLWLHILQSHDPSDSKRFREPKRILLCTMSWK